ncbi:methyl-accepting chemotaxis protein [Heliophilum fasciatum]|uniref:Methyl-accepting chemotaxis protein (MCP) signaling protein n=1 Tax=Heliophilum fasciatum TaxID=35700 RepID=A0A4R2RPC2_9FIRM|nr:methyl-accepting chemotaxis protein [Heliophilum fasciatum]MCW2277871.1 methyl-accepting chemotaxis protein [Heliophilum fasciatum]TCP64559.1 methyl-accepting chemotaxis protein (MCP) signaling protein [Heliophilum fasciatum]
MSVIESMAANLAVLQKLSPHDCCVFVTNEDGLVQAIANAKTFSLKLAIGSKVSSSGATSECLQTRRAITKILSKDVYGIPARSVSIPLLDDGVMVGAMAMVTTLESQDVLQKAAQTIAATSEEITASTMELANSAAQLANNLSSLQKNGDNVLEHVKKTDGILRFVSEVASNSNLLGLNAAIEAARAGESGRGFAVVADEIRKMADNSAAAVKDINQILKAIQSDMNIIVRVLSETSELGERQAAATQEISASMEQLVSSAENIEKLSTIY